MSERSNNKDTHAILLRLAREGKWFGDDPKLIEDAKAEYGQGRPMTLDELRNAAEGAVEKDSADTFDGWAAAARDGAEIDEDVMAEMRKDRASKTSTPSQDKPTDQDG